MAIDDILNKIQLVNFPQEQYVPRETVKKQIYIHHTVSGVGVKGDINYWLSTTDRIATCMIIDRDGTPFQCFSSKYWGYHLGVKKEIFEKYKLPYDLLDDNSIGVEIDSYGGLIKKDGKWLSVYGNVINPKNIIEYPEGFRGFYAFEKYTDEQIDTLKQLLLYWCNKYNIPKIYNKDMWDVSVNALSGKAGIWGHVSVRGDNNPKSDPHPQPELINMLKSL
jgi:N-acetyl-anhydromuramyl-L-alanine amidase AmpD